ncbi:MAG: hypothetical protein ACK56I_12785, partial [bacterium]
GAAHSQREFTENLRRVPRGPERGEERGRFRQALTGLAAGRQSGSGTLAPLDANIGGQIGSRAGRRPGPGLPFPVVGMQKFHHLRVVVTARHLHHLRHGVIERQGLAVLTVAGQRVEAIDGGQDAR